MSDAEPLCACGRPLHYGDPRNRDLVQALIDKFGEETVVHVLNVGHYKVQRHFIALHGLKAAELPELLQKGIVRYA
jgi:hypothetical protein